MGLHIGNVDGQLLNEVSEIIDMMCEHSAVFNAATLIDDMHNKTTGTRVRHKDIVSQFSIALNEMQDSGILFAFPPPTQHQEKRQKTPPAPKSAPTSLEEEEPQKMSYYEAQASGGKKGGRHAASTATHG